MYRWAQPSQEVLSCAGVFAPCPGVAGAFSSSSLVSGVYTHVFHQQNQTFLTPPWSNASVHTVFGLCITECFRTVGRYFLKASILDFHYLCLLVLH